MAKPTQVKREVQHVRYQVITNGEVWNYAGHEKAHATEKLATLKKAGITATFWDCRDNALSNLFSGLLGGND